MKKRLLYLVHRIPYPPNKGDKIRSFNILKYLANGYEIHLGTFIDDANDWQYVAKLDDYCVERYVAPLKSLQSKLKSLPALLGKDPMTVPYYSDAGLTAWLAAQRKRYDFDAVLVFSSAMAQYVMSSDWDGIKRVIDFVDVDSDKWLQYAQAKSWPMNWLYRREATTLLAYDKSVAKKFDASMFVSSKEAALFKELYGEAADKTGHFDNGVDTDYFSPRHSFESPYAADKKNIVFTGAMDYWANEDAVVWFAEKVMPLLQSGTAEVEFYIVGNRPGKRVEALAQLDGVFVTGSVKDVRPYLAHADVAVAPMRIARGVQNKVLEAMAMAKPVVVTQQGFDGIDAEPGRDLLVENDASAFAAALQRLCNDSDFSASIAAAAREQVETKYSWHSCLQPLTPALEA